MKVFNSRQMQGLEERADQNGISLALMMENAGAAAVRFILKKRETQNARIVIVCGKGNNGGDGFVCARLLTERGAKVTVVLTQGEPATGLAAHAFAAMPAAVYVLRFDKNEAIALRLIQSADILIDGIFGFGFHGQVRGNLEPVIEAVNCAEGLVVALDLPSGAQCDDGAVNGSCIRADYTVSFSALKPAHLLYPAKEYCGEVSVAPVGIPAEVIEQYPDAMQTYQFSEITTLFPPRNPISNKGDYGKLLCVCGCEGMAGAAMMAGQAALRCGAGLVQMALPESIYPVVAGVLCEPVYTLYHRDAKGILPEDQAVLLQAVRKADVLLIGCGLGKDPGAVWLVNRLLEEAKCPIVVDADGINLLAENIDILNRVKVPVILTPHPGEMARLLQTETAAIQRDRLESAQKFSEEFDVTVVLKGAGSLVVSPQQGVYLNVTGNAGMAKGGSGDVLAGMIASFMAQGMPPYASAVAGVYLHGLAGDRCAQKKSQRAMLPTDMIAALPEIFLAVEGGAFA